MTLRTMHKHRNRRELRDAPVAVFYPGMNGREINRLIRKAMGRVRSRRPVDIGRRAL